jgi:hypothetical protein
LAGLTDFTKSKEFEDMFSNATQSGVITITSSGKSNEAGLNLGGIFGGNSSNSSTTDVVDDSRRRAVTANILSSAVTQFTSKLATTSFCEGETCAQDQASTLIQLILGRAKQVSATAKEKEDGSFDLAAEGFEASLSKEDVNALVKTSDDSKLKFSDKSAANASYAGVSAGGSDDKSFESGDTRGIEWSKNAKNEWVPTSVKLYVIREGQIKQDISVQQLAIVAGPQQSGRPVPLATIAPPNDLTSAVEDAVATNEQQSEVDFGYLLRGPPQYKFPLAMETHPAPGMFDSPYCWSVVGDNDGDYVKLKNGGASPVPAAVELLRISLVSNAATENDVNGRCKNPINESRGVCFVGKRWMIWFKLTRAASATLDSLLLDICVYQLIPTPGPMTALLPPPPQALPKSLPVPTAHQYVKWMQTIKPQ